MNGNQQFLLYTALDGAVKVEVYLKDETVWLTQKALAELFGVKVPAINRHLKNIFESGELLSDSTISILETTAADGKSYQEVKVGALEAKLKAEAEYEVFRQRQDRKYVSDFDREIKRLEGKK
ncbi:MAG: hypothetical protein A4E66_00609 [Syntrophus sp. PtaB.Bin001]|nr:MAG: hypothetical protein A4E66_00609 [Syntrophus sp. PtaB.Bin001]